MQGPDDILVDDWAAKAKKVNVGGTFRLLDHDFHVAGIVEHGKGARLFVPITTLQDLSGSRERPPSFSSSARARITPSRDGRNQATFFPDHPKSAR